MRFSSQSNGIKYRKKKRLNLNSDLERKVTGDDRLWINKRLNDKDNGGRRLRMIMTAHNSLQSIVYAILVLG